MSSNTLLSGLAWLSDRIGYPELSVTGDTYPLTWGADDAIYMSAGDPMWGICGDDYGLDAEKIVGDPPSSWRIYRTSLMPEYLGYGGAGAKPTGMISVDGVLYMAVQNLLGSKKPAHGESSQHGSDASILRSNDGHQWLPQRSGLPIMFPGSAFGGPAFVQFGKDNRDAVDGFVYAVSADQWDNGSDLRLGRVPKDRVQDAGAWSFVSEIRRDGAPEWARDLAQACPVLTAERSIGAPEMVYIPKLNRYLLLTWRLNGDFSPRLGTSLFIYEAPTPWGPFALIYEEAMWETQAVNPYCPRLPLKWFDAETLTGWLLFSGSWDSLHDGLGYRPYYRANVRKFRLLLR